MVSGWFGCFVGGLVGLQVVLSFTANVFLLYSHAQMCPMCPISFRGNIYNNFITQNSISVRMTTMK